MVKNPSPDPPFISHYAIIQGEMGLFLTFSVFELQRGYLYQNGVEFRQKVIGAGLNLFWGHLHYFSGGIWTFPLLSDTYASAPIAERAIFFNFWGTEGLFISKWGRISPESDWCWLKLVLGLSSLLLRGYTDLSLDVGHMSECPHSGMRYFVKKLTQKGIYCKLFHCSIVDC